MIISSDVFGTRKRLPRIETSSFIEESTLCCPHWTRAPGRRRTSAWRTSSGGRGCLRTKEGDRRFEGLRAKEMVYDSTSSMAFHATSTAGSWTRRVNGSTPEIRRRDRFFRRQGHQYSCLAMGRALEVRGLQERWGRPGERRAGQDRLHARRFSHREVAGPPGRGTIYGDTKKGLPANSRQPFFFRPRSPDYGQATAASYVSQVSSSGASTVGSAPQGCVSSGNGPGSGILP